MKSRWISSRIAANPISAALAFLLLTVLGSTVFGDAALAVLDRIGLFSADTSSLGLSLIICIGAAAVFIIGVGGLYSMRQRLLPTRARISEQPPQTIFGLVAGLSSKSPEYVQKAHPLADKKAREEVAATLKLAGIALNEAERKRRIDDPLTPEAERQAFRLLDRFPWQQTVRAIHTLKDCREIILLTTERSHREVGEFIDFFKAAWDGPTEKKPNITAAATPIDFERYNDVADAASLAVETLREKLSSDLQGVSDDAICIDITAGMKIFSIAAAVVTLNKSLNFSYVNNQGIVRFFDAQIIPIETISD